MIVQFVYRWGRWKAGAVVDLPRHIAEAFCNSPSPNNGEPFAIPVSLDDDGEDLSELTVPELRGRLRAADLKVSGTKAALIARLEANR